MSDLNDLCWMDGHQQGIRDRDAEWVKWAQDVTGVYVTTTEQARSQIEGIAAEAMRLLMEGLPEAVAADVAAERERVLTALADLPERMGKAWGGPSSWLTTGERVAAVVADWLRDFADEERAR